MRFLFRLIPFILGIASIGGFVFLAIFPRQFAAIILILSSILVYGVFELFNRRFKGKDFPCFAGLLLLFTVSGLAFFSHLDNLIEKILVALFISTLLVIFTEQFYRWFYSTDKIPSYALSVTLTLIELFIIFFAASDLIGFRIFLRLPTYFATLIFSLLILLVYFSVRVMRGVARGNNLLGIFLAIIFGEIMWAMLLLPTSFMVGGAIIAIIWYVVAGLIRVHESGLSIKISSRRYALLTTILIAVIILTARWI